MERIEVCVRVRPLNKKESDRAERLVVETQGGNEVLVGFTNSKQPDPKKGGVLGAVVNQTGPKGAHIPTQSYKFNNCFSEDATTEELYERTVKRLVKSSLGGVNCTVFAYGPTGSGKTFTMMGGGCLGTSVSDPDHDFQLGKKNHLMNGLSKGTVSPLRTSRTQEHFQFTAVSNTPLADCESAFRSKYEAGDGLITMAVRDLFRQIGIEASQGTKMVSILCSFLEIYNDQVYDLLRTHDKLSEELPVVEMNVGFFNSTERVLHSRRD